MPTVPIPARKVVTTFDAASRHERPVKPPLTRLFRRTITKAFSVWLKFPDRIGTVARLASTCSEPYVGLRTEHCSRSICRTVYGPFKRQRRAA